MKLTVYIDVLIIINTLINYFLLKITAVRLKLSPDSRFLFLSSFTGALFSLFILSDIEKRIIVIIRILSLLICTITAFGYNSLKIFTRQFFVYSAVNMLFTGFINLFVENNPHVYINNMFYYIYINPFKLVISVCIIYIFIVIFDLIFDNKHKNEIKEFSVTFGNEPALLKGFYDTGFNIKDIISRKNVMLCSMDVAEKYMNGSVTDVLKNFTENENSSQLNIIPVFYTDISGDGILPAVRPAKITYKDKELKNVIIAFCNNKISEDVQIIFGKDIYNMLGD